MRFKIVSVGWRCAPFFVQTLRSIEMQSVDNYDLWITYDGGDGAGADIQRWCDERDERWNCTINPTQQYAVRNQVETIKRLAPADDDVVVFLDLDGDQFAHQDVLAHLAGYYADGTLVTYGSYVPIPDPGTCTPATPFPPDVVRANSYRQSILRDGCRFNHLRTMAGRVVNAIPDDQFQWQRGPKRGQWYDHGTDYIFMTAALELAAGRYRCINEVLLKYNAANPNADFLSHPTESDACTQDYLRRSPLAPLPTPLPEPLPKETFVPESKTSVFLTAEERRQVLRKYGREFGLKVLIETGTNDGGTPWELRKDFAEIYTIELGERQWQAAVKRFRDYPHIHCLLGDSAVVLPKVLAKITEPALLWLDGHHSGNGTARGDKDSPILEELQAVIERGVKHVVLIDDARIFGGMPEQDEWDWPHMDEVYSIALCNGYDFEIRDDIVRLVPSGG